MQIWTTVLAGGTASVNIQARQDLVLSFSSQSQGVGGGAWEAIAWVHCLVGSGKISAIAKLAGLERSLETEVSMALQNIPTDAELNQPTDSQH